MTVPYSFGAATSAIPLSQLDSNFNTPITLGNTAIQLGNTVTTLNNMTLANVTISSGSVTFATANAVVYTNSSNVATTSTALTFDGTSLGVGSTAATQTLIRPYTGGSYGAIYSGAVTPSGTNFVLAYNATETDINAGTFTSHLIGGSEQMRLTSTGLGIGLGGSNPTARLQSLSGAVEPFRFRSSSAGWNYMAIGHVTSGDLAYIGDGASTITSGSNNDLGIQVKASGGLVVATGGSAAAKMTLDSSGNLGLGVTPSAWATYKAMEVGGAALSLMAGTSGTIFGSLGVNWYYDGTNRVYKNTSAASYYNQANGTHAWYTAPSGTAGTAITFTQAMTLDASGNLLVGTTTAFSPLTVNGSNRLDTMTVGDIGTASNAAGIYLRTTGNAGISWAGGGYLAFYGGGVGSTERARIDSSGNLLVGTTSGSTGNNNGLILGSAAINVQHVSGTASGTSYENYWYNGSLIGSITQNGTTSVNFNGYIVNPSDQKLKTNIANAPSAFGVVDNIQIRSFDWIAEEKHQSYGVIAQELEEVFPEAVNAPTTDDGYYGVDYTKLVPVLVKAIQEQQALITQLTERITALEGAK